LLKRVFSPAAVLFCPFWFLASAEDPIAVLPNLSVVTTSGGWAAWTRPTIIKIKAIGSADSIGRLIVHLV
jgi:hypothetical protein